MSDPRVVQGTLSALEGETSRLRVCYNSQSEALDALRMRQYQNTDHILDTREVLCHQDRLIQEMYAHHSSLVKDFKHLILDHLRPTQAGVIQFLPTGHCGCYEELTLSDFKQSSPDLGSMPNFPNINPLPVPAPIIDTFLYPSPTDGSGDSSPFAEPSDSRIVSIVEAYETCDEGEEEEIAPSDLPPPLEDTTDSDESNNSASEGRGRTWERPGCGGIRRGSA